MFPALSSWDPVTQMNTGKPLSPFETHNNRNSCSGFQFHQRTAREVNSISRSHKIPCSLDPSLLLSGHSADPTRRSQAALPAAAAPLLLELALSTSPRLAPSVPPSAPAPASAARHYTARALPGGGWGDLGAVGGAPDTQTLPLHTQV